MKLNLGCGNDIRRGHINVDINNPKCENWDLEKKLPIKDDSVIYIYASHILEHIKNNNQLIEEMHRVCTNGAIIEIIVPHHMHNSAYCDEHEHFYNSSMLARFIKKDNTVGSNLGLFEVVSFDVIYDLGFNVFGWIGELFFKNKIRILETTPIGCLIVPNSMRMLLEVVKGADE